MINSPLSINNAGLVMFQSYLVMLFDRLGLVKVNQFVSLEAQRSAIHYLQYLATGKNSTPEQSMALNKVLCGIPLSAPIESCPEMSPSCAGVVNSLIEAVIHYWSAIGETSLEGFRGEWLVREGELSESEDRWNLVIEKRAYDILLDQCPLSYSIIKLPWMDKPVYVTWPT